MNTQTNHLDLEDRIDLYVRGTLNQKQIDDLWVDVIQFGYLDYMKTAATVRKLSVGKRVIPIPIRTPSRMRLVASAAAAAVIIGVGTSIYFLASSTSTSEFMPLEQIEFNLLRSGSIPTEIFDLQLLDITIMAVEGQEGKAEQALIALLSTELNVSQDVEVRLNLAALAYNRGDFAPALVRFDEIRAMNGVDPIQMERTEWYTANALIQSGQQDEAQVHLKRVIDMNGAFGRAAQSALDQLRR